MCVCICVHSCGWCGWFLLCFMIMFGAQIFLWHSSTPHEAYKQYGFYQAWGVERKHAARNHVGLDLVRLNCACRILTVIPVLGFTSHLGLAQLPPCSTTVHQCCHTDILCGCIIVQMELSFATCHCCGLDVI